MAKARDFEILLDSTRKLGGFQAAQRSAQELIDTIYGHFQESLVLLRLFISVPFSALPPQDQELVEKKANDSGTMDCLKKTTPVLTLLGTRGRISAWDERSKSSGISMHSADFDQLCCIFVDAVNAVQKNER